MSRSATARIVLTHPAGWIASGLGTGFSPWAPGTVGSMAALLPWWLWLRHLETPDYLALVAAAFVAGTWAAQRVIARTGIQDPSLVVCDEFVGQWLALFWLPAGWPWLLAGFALFRLFDIWKPWPVRWADQKLHGGFGTMLDDVFAGLYALAVLQLAATFFH